MKRFYFFVILFIYIECAYSQNIFSEFPGTMNFSRRMNLIENDSIDYRLKNPSIFENLEHDFKIGLSKDSLDFIEPLPMFFISKYNSGRPYGWGDLAVIPNVGFQQYLSTGLNIKYKFFNIRIQPEIVWAQNNRYQGLSDDFYPSFYFDRYSVWSVGDFPERLANSSYFKFLLGQSKFTFSIGSFELGVSNENFWWGPSQFNSLTFSNNAPGFPRFEVKTLKSLKTFLGKFETDFFIGSLSPSGIVFSQNDSLNLIYGKKGIVTSKRYLNGLMVSYQPKWIDNLWIGFGRTFQVYDSLERDSFLDWFPVFEGLQKVGFFENGNTVEYDANSRDQQFVIFGNYRVSKFLFDLYFEFGRRDHSYNWREFVLNPEHARAFILGFIKILNLKNGNSKIQILGEITQQQPSINRNIRYSRLNTGSSWHEHSITGGFTNLGQGLGVGVGQGSNVQTIEISLVNGYEKKGITIERVERDMGFFYRVFPLPSENKPWIDLSLGFLYDKQFNNLLLSSKLQLIHARNYQWQLDPASTPEFPKGENLTSVMAQVSAIYFWKRN